MRVDDQRQGLTRSGRKSHVNEIDILRHMDRFVPILIRPPIVFPCNLAFSLKTELKADT